MNFSIVFVCLFVSISVSAQTFRNEDLPIEVKRTISFTTNEGSYTDVDISPDGRTILFSLLGDLYSVPAAGGEAKQLTHGLAIKRHPVWSPDGKWIAYESDASGFVKLHVMDPLGRFDKMLGGENPNNSRFRPMWLPNSKQIVINNEVFHVAANSSVLPNGIINPLHFSKDEKYIFCLESLSTDSSAIVRLDRTTLSKSIEVILKKAYSKFINVSISPDMNWLTYWKSNSNTIDSMMIINLKTGKERLLASLNLKFPGYASGQHYSFSKDSKYLFIGYGGEIHKITIETGLDVIIPLTVHANIDMGHLNYNTFNVSLRSFNGKYIRNVRPSPDGKHLVFSAMNRVYIMDLPNGKPRVLITQSINQFQPTYSPDGKWIAYVSWCDTAGGQVWRVPSKGGMAEQLTTVASIYQHPSWSPDGSQIVVAKGKNKLGSRDNLGTGQIQIISVENKSAKIIADTVPLFNQPSFSPDGKEVMFQPNQKGADGQIWAKLVSLNLESKDKRVFATARKNDEFISPIRQIILSPDGKYIVFVYNENLYLVPSTNIGTPQEILNIINPITLIRFARAAIDPNWEKEGKVLSWVQSNKYCRIDPDKIIAAAMYIQPNKTLEGLPQTNIIDVDIHADRTITINLETPLEYGKGMIALTNARIITMKGNKVIENGTVLINDGRFVSIDASGHVNVPDQVKAIDLKGKTIIPGLVDMHSHMYEAVPPDIFLQQSWQRLLNFSYGVTTVRDPSGSFDTFGYSELVETGQMIGPRLFTTDHAVRPNYILNSLHEANVIVKNRAALGATVVKQYTQPSRLQRQLLLIACKKQGLNMTNEVEEEPLSCLGMFKDGTTGIEHNPIWGEVYNDVITFVAKSGTYLCPTLQVCYGRTPAKSYFRKMYGQKYLSRSSRFIPENYRKELLKDINAIKIDSGFLDQSKINARIKHAGGKIVMGSHGEDQGIGAHWEIWALQMGGLTNHEALETATITAAEALGMQKDLGSIEVGKIADLIILDKNPLEDIHNTNTIKYVMKAGVLYDSETLDEVWPERKKGPTVWR